MLKRRTLFVVGAGASIPLGFPTGVELVNGIAAKLRFHRDGDGQFVGDQRLWGAVENQSKSGKYKPTDYFEAALEMSEGIGLTDSIDRYVDTHANKPLFALLAKLCIAEFILDAEARSVEKFFGLAQNFRSRQIPTGYWMHAFCRLHFAGYKEGSLEKIFDNVAFLSFNYDRCIQHSLAIGLAKHFRLTNENASIIADSALVLHPYGSLGSFIPSDLSPSTALPFGVPVGRASILSASLGIRTFTEGPESATFSAQMQSVIDWCEDIIFLGFGFAAPNLRIIGRPSDSYNIKRIFGTAFQMKKPNVDFLDQILPQQFNSHNPRPLRSDLRAEELLDEYSLELFQ